MKCMRILSVALVGALILLLVCCTSRHEATFAHADSLMEEHPDSALALLESIDTATLTTDRDRAIYGLLLTQAMYKNGIWDDSDSLIASSARYFNADNNLDYKVRANFYLGAVNYMLGNNNNSVKAALEAFELANEQKNPLWQARSAELLGDIYRFVFLSSEELKYRQLALKYYQEASWTKNISWAKLELAIAYMNLFQYDKTDSLMSVAIKEAELKNDTALIDACLKTKLKEHIICENIDEAEKTLATLNNRNVNNRKNSLELLELDVAVKIGKGEPVNDSVWQILASDTVGEMQNRAMYFTNLRSYYKNKDYKLSTEYADSIINLFNCFFDQISRQTILEAQKLYIEDKLSVEEQNRENAQRTSVLLVLLIILLVSLGLTIYRYKIKILRAKKEAVEAERAVEKANYERLLEEYDALKDLVESKEVKNDEIRSILLKRFTQLNDFILSYDLKSENDINNITTKASTILADKAKFVTETRMALESLAPRFMDYLRECGLTEEEQDYVCLYAIGLSGKDVGTFIGRTGHYNISKDIRAKFGLTGHTTTLAMFVAQKFDELSARLNLRQDS